MAGAMAPWGYETGDRWLGEGVGIAGNPIPVAGGSAIVFASGRLDNRHDLCAALHIEPARRAGISTAALIAAAYERWADDAPRRILGDWAFAAYHPATRRLVLARDHFGHTGLYYHRAGSTLAFASSLKALLVLPHVPRRLNELRLAHHLVAWPADGAATFYEGISRLPPAHVLTADATTLSTREYWHPRDAPDVRLRTDDAYVEHFVELFTEAVRVRLPERGVVASTQSAGLDSSAVTALAAREQLARDERLTALTAVPAYREAAGRPGALADEWPLAAMALRGRSNVDHLRVDGAGITPVQAIARSHAIHDEPVWAISNLPWILAMLETCQARGEPVLLTGQFGNGGVSWSGNEAMALGRLRAGDPRGALRALAARRGGPGGSWALALRRELAGPVRRRIVGERARLARRRGSGAIGTLIAPALARRLDLEARMAEAGFDATFARASAADRRLATLLPGLQTVGALWSENSRAYDVDVRDPTADVRLLEFCFGVPDDQFVRGDQARWLMRRGLRDIVPDAVRCNRLRGHQGVDISARLCADADTVTAAVQRIGDSELARSSIDVEGLRASWEAVRAAPSPPIWGEAVAFARGLGIGLFLVRLEAGCASQSGDLGCAG